MSDTKKANKNGKKVPQKPWLSRVFSPELLAATALLGGLSVVRLHGGFHLALWHEVLEATLVGGVTLLLLRRATRYGLGEERFWLSLVLGGGVLSVVSSAGSPYLVLWGLTAGLGSLFFGAAFGIHVLLPLGVWGMVYLGVGPTVAGFLAGLLMAVAMAEVRRAREFLAVGALAGAAAGIVTLLFLSQAGTVGVLAAFLSGPAATLLIWSTLPLVEQVLDRTSPLSLVELLDPSHPLLEELRREAPGTYYHSRNVSALAEAAARAIGANALLAAVGGLYHDIGKLTRPDFFVENQEGTNPHDELNPSLSKVILAAHVKEGIELARRHGLRGDVIHFITTHHGTSVMRYFSERGAEQGLSADEFRYANPLPDTRETAIVMLADPLEAAARVRPRGEIPELVEAMVEERVRDGQLDRAPLTIAELAKVKQAFVKVLQGMAHSRVVDYPMFQGQ